MTHVSPSMLHGIQVVTDADLLRMPGHDTRFAGAVTTDPDAPRARAERAWLSPRAWLAALRRAPAQVSH